MNVACQHEFPSVAVAHQFRRIRNRQILLVLGAYQARAEDMTKQMRGLMLQPQFFAGSLHLLSNVVDGEQVFVPVIECE